MFFLSFIDNFDNRGFITGMVVEGIERKLLLLGEGYVSFEADTVEGEIASDVVLLHDLLAEFEDGVVAGKVYYFLLGLVHDHYLYVGVEIYVYFYCFALDHLEEAVYSSKADFRIVLQFLDYF